MTARALGLLLVGLLLPVGAARGVIRLGGYNHSIGLATHEVMGAFAGADEVLAAGFVFACDIQLFSVAEEIGIRIEDTIAIAPGGYENSRPGCREPWRRSRAS